MALTVAGGTSGVVAEVDANKNLNVVTPSTIAQAGYVKNAGGDGLAITTSGAFSGAPTVGSAKNRLKAGQDSILVYDPIDGAALHSNIWQAALTTANFTIVQANSFLTLNSANSTTASSGSMVFTAKQFQRVTSFPVVARWLMKVPNQSITNGTMEVGFGTYATIATSAIAAVTDGAFFRFGTSGLTAVTVFNGSETSSATLTSPSTTVNSYMIVRKATGVDFYINDVVVATVTNPAANPGPANTSRLPFFARAFSGGSTATAAPRIDLGEVVVFQEDINNTRPWPDQMAGSGRHSVQSPVTTFLQTANHANSTSPASATLSNTAAGYTTLGGRYQFAAPGGAATDFVLFGFQVPAGFTFHITDIAITAMNTGAAVATTATILDWSVAVGSSAVSLATADAAATSGVAQTWSPRRLALGMHGFAVAAAIGATSPDIIRTLRTPLVCEGGRFVQMIVQVPVGTATASQVIRGDVMVNGYFE